MTLDHGAPFGPGSHPSGHAGCAVDGASRVDPSRVCTSCGSTIGSKAKTGMCRPCWCRRIGRDPEIRARTGATMSKVWKRPGYAERVGQRISEAQIRVMAERPEVAAMRREICSQLGKSGLGMAAQAADPTYPARLAQAVSNARMGWCPPALREAYRALRNRHGAEEARKRIEAMIGKDDCRPSDDPEIASRRLLAALLAYGSKHGLPNIAANDCADRLRRLAA